MGEAERGSAKGETGGASMEFTMNKSRVNMGGTSLYEKCPAEGEPAVIFEGTAREAIQLLPGHVNVAVAAALATVGPDKMRVIINSDPNDPDDEMHSRIRADKASAHLIIRSVPADIAAWSVVALLNNLASPIQFA
jgi:aspartate dehydrogenase